MRKLERVLLQAYTPEDTMHYRPTPSTRESACFSTMLTLLAFSGLLFWLRAVVLNQALANQALASLESVIAGIGAYLFIGFVVIVTILTDVVVFLVVIILEVALLHIFIEFFKLQSFPCEPIDCSRDEFFLDIFTQLIVEF